MSRIDLSTRYLGLDLTSPLVVSASPLSHELASIRALAGAGAGAIVLYSLFEEQIREQDYRRRWYVSRGLEVPERQIRYSPPPDSFATDPEGYVRHLERALATVDIPVIPSLNGATIGGWTRYARLLEQAGAPALELNLYTVPTDLDHSAAYVEEDLVSVFEAVRESVEIPLAVKMSPYFTAVGHVAKRLAEAGADGLVLFNRFYEPDIDLDSLAVVPQPLLSGPEVLRLPLRWIALLSGRLDVSLAASGGVLAGADALKVLLAGADVAMLCSTLLRHGPAQLGRIRDEIVDWLAAHDHASVDEIRGKVSAAETPDSTAFERGHYIRAIQGAPVEP